MSKSDIYSAAMVIVVLDNRRPPTRNEKTNEELLTIKDEKLNTLVNKCLQQNPNDRPSVQECIGLLEELLKKFEKNESFERLPKRQLESQPTVNDFRDKLDASKVTIDRLLENFFDRLLENKLQLSNSNLVRENTLPNRFNKQQQRDHTSREQISLLLESLLLFSMCADIKIWPLFIEIANRCLRKLAYLIKIFTRPFYLKVFMNTTTLEEWYYLKEIPIKGHKHQWKQHIFLKKDTLQGKLLVGALVDEESQLTVFDPRTEIEQHKMQFLAFEVITPEWVLERIKSLHFKRDAIIHMMVQTAQSTPVFSDEKLRAHLTTGFEEEFTDIYQTNDRKESILAMRVRFLTIPRSVLLTYYGWSLKELPVYQKFYHRIGLLNVMNKKSLQPLYRTLSLEDFEKDIETKFSSTHLDFYVWNRGNEPKVFLLEPPRCINGFKKTVKGFTKKYNFTEVNLEKNSQKQFTQETVDLTVFEKTFTARLSAIKGNIKKSITHVK
ncbi:unnamed protein product, partial [Mesorhabditis belari]|uniref:Protein kinase domain-containing protein n=1 Tax=Mesorhabditis belari TaxID=2138241 RepID=A0AAF3F2Y1_9BILA